MIQIFKIIIGYITDPKAAGRDIYLICAKSILKEISGSACFTIGNVILPFLLTGIKGDHLEIKELSFEIFNDYINTFNYILIKDNNIISEKDFICDNILKSLNIENDSLRKILTKFLGNFSLLLTDDQVNNLIKQILSFIDTTDNFDSKIIYFIALNSIGKSTATKNVSLISNILPYIFKYADQNFLMQNMQDYDKSNEIAEACLNILETYLIKNSTSLRFKIQEIIKLSIEFSQYDPNFSYDNEQDDYSNQYNDDYEMDAFADDSSWKIRRASIRILSAIVKSRMEIEKNEINYIIENLVISLREHEENTKEDIINCLCGYLRNLTINELDEDNNIDTDENYGLIRHKSVSLSVIPHIFSPLLENIKKILISNNNNFITGGLNLLNSLSTVAANEIVFNLEEIKPIIIDVINKNSANFNLILFSTFNNLLKSKGKLQRIQDHMDSFINWMIMGLKNDYYKVNIESSNMASHLIKIMKENLTEKDLIPKLKLIITEIIPKFKSNDLDQELKSSLISTGGNIVMYMGDYLNENELNIIFDIFLDKFKNENLLNLTTNWIVKILRSNLKINLTQNLKKFLPAINDLIDKNNTSLRQNAVIFLSNILQHYPLAVKNYEKVLINNLLEYSSDESFIPNLFEVLLLISENFKLEKDLILLTIKECAKIIENNKLSSKSAESLLLYISNTLKFLNPEEFENFIEPLLKYSNMNSNKSKFIAILSSESKSSEKLIKEFFLNLSVNSKRNSEEKKNILLLLGDISLISNYSSKEIFKLLSNILKDINDEIKPNASVTLAKVAISNPSEYLVLLKTLMTPESIRYALSSIREFIHLICDSKYNINLNNEYIFELFNMLLKAGDSQDEKITKLCGECFGLLAGKSSDILDKYINFLDDPNDNIRSGFYYGLKSFNFVKDEKLLDILFNKLLKGLNDSSIIVKQNAYNSLITFAHDYSSKFKFKFMEIWSCFELDCVVKNNLIETTDIGGGLKIKNDKGSPIRKAIFATIKIFIENIPEKINLNSAIKILLLGLGKKIFYFKFILFLDDDDDICSLSFGSLSKILNFAAGSIVSFIDHLLDILKNKFEVLKKSNPQVENKKYSYFVITCKRLCKEMKKTQEIEENPKFIDFNKEIQAINIE